MQLPAYLADRGETLSGFARRSGIGSRQTVHAYVNGRRFPTPENLLRIRVATGGAVTADDFVDQHTGGVSAAPEPVEAA